VHEIKEHSRDRFLAQFARTRELLGDRLALYQVHSLTVDSPLFTDEALLADLAASGIRTGFSTSGPAQAETIRKALALTVHGKPLFTAVQSTWNPLETSVGPALAQAHRDGAHVLVKEALANGRLAVQPPEPVTKLAKRHKVGPDAIALAAALAQPWADTVLVGPASVPQLRSNLKAQDIGLTTTELDELTELARPPEEYWAHRATLPWN
jgi:aryl-alcohol dehydrogenase-like predicted oxidoreductase